MIACSCYLLPQMDPPESTAVGFSSSAFVNLASPSSVFPPLESSPSTHAAVVGLDCQLPSHPVSASPGGAGGAGGGGDGGGGWDATTELPEESLIPAPHKPLVSLSVPELKDYLRTCGVEPSTLAILEAQHFDGRAFLLSEPHLPKLGIPLGPLILLQQIIKNELSLEVKGSKRSHEKTDHSGPRRPPVPPEILQFWESVSLTFVYFFLWWTSTSHQSPLFLL